MAANNQNLAQNPVENYANQQENIQRLNNFLRGMNEYWPEYKNFLTSYVGNNDIAEILNADEQLCLRIFEIWYHMSKILKPIISKRDLETLKSFLKKGKEIEKKKEEETNTGPLAPLLPNDMAKHISEELERFSFFLDSEKVSKQNLLYVF